MRNSRLEAQLLEICEKVKMLEKNPDEETIQELTRLIQESKNLTNQYPIWNATKARIELAYNKLNEAEDLAMDFKRNLNKNPSSPSDLKIVFETFLDGLIRIFA